MRNLNSTELQHVYGGGQPDDKCKSNSNNKCKSKSNNKCKTKSKGKSCDC